MDNLKQQFERAYEDYSDSIFRYLLIKTRDRQSALDLTQETFVRTWEYILRGKTVREMRPFLYRVAHNLWCKFVRRERRQTSLDALTDGGWQVASDEDTERDVALKEDQRRVLDKLGELDDEHREILVLRYLEEMSIGEIAGILGKTENVVSVRIHRAKEQLRSMLKDELI